MSDDKAVTSVENGGLIVDGHGRLSWWNASLSAATAAVISPVSEVAVSVDLTDPRRVLSWTAANPDALAHLVPLFGESWQRSMLEVLAGPGTPGAVLAPPPLPEAWARHALVAGAKRWTTGPIPEATLTIDHALALLGVGLDHLARTEFALGWATLLDLAELCLHGDLPAAMRPGLLAATRAAVALLADHPDAGELAAAVTALEAADLGAQALRPDLIQVTGASILGLDSATPPDLQAEASADAVTTVLVDPVLVPPRILHWDGPSSPELLVETHHSQDLLRVSMVLTEDIEPDDAEVAELLVRAVDPEAGTTWSVEVPTPIAGGRLVADLPLYGRSAASVVVQLYRAERPNPILTTARSPALVHIDRLMLQAWSLQRLARAAPAITTAAPTHSPRRRLVQAAIDYAQQAYAELDTLRHRPAAPTPAPHGDSPLLSGLRQATGTPNTSDLQARMAAVQAYLHMLADDDRPDPQPADPVTEPLLAELQLVATGDLL